MLSIFGIPIDELPMQQSEALPLCQQCHDTQVEDPDQLCEDCEEENLLALHADILQDDLKYS